jgi:hypothetical protein
MVLLKTRRIPKCSFREPFLNLRKYSSSREAEQKFTIKFARAYLSQYHDIHNESSYSTLAVTRELPINGFGIADFVAVAWDSRMFPAKSRLFTSDMFIKHAKPTIRAFESKLKNWPNAMMQANRYKYFSNVVIVVMPTNQCLAPLEHLDIFKAINVGLWGFEINKDKIIPYYTPRKRAALDARYQERALKLVSCASKALPIS